MSQPPSRRTTACSSDDGDGGHLPLTRPGNGPGAESGSHLILRFWPFRLRHQYAISEP